MVQLRTRNREVESQGIEPKTIERPSGNQHGSQRSRPFSGRAKTSIAPPPAGTTRTALSGSPGALLTKRICLPSGDHRGIHARSGEVVSCNDAPPSRRPCHSTSSGNEIQANHCPSGDGSTYPTEDPPRKGSNRPSSRSNRRSSALRSDPKANHPFLSGRGPSWMKLTGPLVSWTGCEPVQRGHHASRTMNASSRLVESVQRSTAKSRPSGVQLPRRPG